MKNVAITTDSKLMNHITSNINSTILEVFGENSPEYREHGGHLIWHGAITMGESEYSSQSKFSEGIPQTITMLMGLSDRLKEKFRDLSDINNGDAISKDFWSDIHVKITSVAKSRFENTQYADAVESSLKEVNKNVKDIVKRKTGDEFDGAKLMRKAFSPNDPIIVLDDLSTLTGKNIQQGYMEIFAGAIIGIRNPKTHNNIEISENRAKHFIYLASLLMQKIDERI